jgi:hypothetical protein
VKSPRHEHAGLDDAQKEALCTQIRDTVAGEWLRSPLLQAWAGSVHADQRHSSWGVRWRLRSSLTEAGLESLSPDFHPTDPSVGLLQGGKYVGFGSVGSAPPAPASDNPLGALIGGFGKLTAAASSAAQQATAKVQNGEVGAKLAQGTGMGLSWLKVRVCSGSVGTGQLGGGSLSLRGGGCWESEVEGGQRWLSG